MPVRKFRSVEEMTPPGERDRSDGGHLLAALELSRTCIALSGVRFQPGVRKFRSIDEAWQARVNWQRARRRTD